MTIAEITTLIGDIFTAIVTGLSTYATGLASGIEAYVSGLIYTSDGYSSAFGFILAMAAVALGVGLTRLVWGFVVSLTARK